MPYSCVCSWVLTGSDLRPLEGIGGPKVTVGKTVKDSRCQLQDLPQGSPATAGETGEETIPERDLEGRQSILGLSGCELLPLLPSSS